MFVLAALCSGARAQAQDAPRFEIGLRFGYGAAFGEAAGGADLDESQVPLILDVGARVMPQLFIGLFGQYGFGILDERLSEACDLSPDSDCSVTDIRVGVEAHYHIQPEEQFDPWLGFGFGYEWLTTSAATAGFQVNGTLSGFEFFNVQGGLDIALSDYFRFGPFVSISIGQFSKQSLSCSDTQSACQALEQQPSIRDKALHEWLIFGVRATVLP